LKPREYGRLALAALALQGGAACSKGPRASPGVAASPAGATAEMRTRALALMEPPGEGRFAAEVRRGQAAVRRAPERAEAWIALGRSWVQLAREKSDPGLYLNAAACADEVVSREPGNRGALQLRGLVLLNDHRFEEARRLAEELLKREPRDVLALGVLSDALVELGRYPEARVAVRRMMELKPGLPAYSRASYLFWLDGDLSRAKESARLAIDAGATGSEARAWVIVQAAMIFWHAGDVEGAEAGFDRALAERPGFPPALVGKGRSAVARGDPAGGARLLAEAWRRAPLVETAWLLADAREAAGDEAGAREALDLAIRHGRATDHRTLALLLATRGLDLPEAVRLATAERAVRDDIYTEDACAWALHRSGRDAEARAASDRALALGTGDARLLFHAGAIRMALGERAAGRALLAGALRHGAVLDRTSAEEARRLLGGRALARRGG
jgi:tetratricopeptide (TPR) repeat protein